VSDTPFISLYRRFRPGRFEELRGQPHVVLALRSAVRDGRVAHAYLFSGPRGTGKTSTARILAKALDCANPVDGEPCGTCTSCVEITRGASPDVHELDAASNNGVEAMRELIAHAALATPGRWKVYIVDEVHMLSNAAANALLKTLEEPPGHVIFVLATTDPQKVPATIRSRTQHFEFRLLGTDVLAELLGDVNRQAGLSLDDASLSVAVRRGRGSARDALSALDQVAAAGSADDTRPELSAVLDAVAESDAGGALRAVAELHAAGWGSQQLASDLIDELRHSFLAALASGSPTARAEGLGLPRLVRAIETIGRAQVDMRDAPDPRVVLEVALARLAYPEIDDSVAALADRVSRLERAAADRAGADRAGADRAGADRAHAPPAKHHRVEGEPPDRDRVVQAWGDQILRSLPARARVLFAPGHFVAVSDGSASFALPNEAHRLRCEEVRKPVEEALSSFFGTPMSVDLVVDSAPAQRPTPAQRPAPAPAAEAMELAEGDDYDPTERGDGRSVAEARLLEAFPGAEEVPG